MVKRVLNAFAKNIGSCQPAQSAQADMERNFSPYLYFLRIKFVIFLPHDLYCLRNN